MVRLLNGILCSLICAAIKNAALSRFYSKKQRNTPLLTSKKESQQLQISSDLSLPLDTVTSTVVVYGGKGMGKTNLGGVLVEELSRCGLRWSVLDPMGVWWGIRHSEDGKGNGVECLILGGAHGDIPIEPHGGAIIADLVADETVNVIIDISRKSTGEMWGVGERIRFANDYGKRLFQRQGSLVDGKRREPIFQVLDEAARYIPQMVRAGQPDVALCLSTWATMVEEGRNIGLGIGLLTQRSARLNKDVAELADLMLAFRTVGPNSINAVIDWLGEHVPKEESKTMIETVRSLPVGSCLAVSPGWLKFEKVVHIRKRRTFDSSATPKPGDVRQSIRSNGAKPDLSKYISRMRDMIARAEKDDPAKLKARIAELERELKKKPAPAKEPQIDTATLLKPIRSQLAKYSEQLRKAQHVARQLVVVLESDDIEATIEAYVKNASVAYKERTSEPKMRPAVQPSNDGLTGPEQRILDAIAWFEAIGVEDPEQPAVAFLAGYSFKSSSYTVPRSILARKQTVEYMANGRIQLTPKGRALAHDTDTPATNAGLHHMIYAKLPGPEGRLLRPLIEAYPDAMTNEDLAHDAGYSAASSSYSVPRSRLKSFGLIEYPASGQVRARDILFPIGG